MPTLNIPTKYQMEVHNVRLNTQNTELRRQNTILTSIRDTILRTNKANADSYVESGLPYIQRRRKDVSSTTVSLYWKEPDTSFSGWTKTVIVKKLGASPVTVDDGTTVVTNTTRDAFATTPYTDAQADGKYWYYKAFIYIDDAVVPTSRLNEFEFWLFGCQIDETDPVPSTMMSAVADTDNYFYEKPYMNFNLDVFNYGGYGSYAFIPFAPKPCMLTYEGEVDYYLNQDDYTKKEDGSDSAVASTAYEGNAMSEWPRIWMKTERASSGTNGQTYLRWYICSEQLDSGYECWPCKKADGTYASHFYMPLYEGSFVTTDGVNRLRSMSTNAVPSASATADTEEARAQANGDGWYTTTWAQESLLRVVFGIFFLNPDSQTVLSGIMTTASSLQRRCGELNTAGMFYGKTGAYSSKFFGMENWWGHRWRRCNGLMLKNGQYYVKMTESMVDGSTTNAYNNTAEGYIATGVTLTSVSGSFMKTVASGRINNVKDALTTAPTNTGGSSTTYYCDAYWTSLTDVRQALLGGFVRYGSSSGVFAVNLYDAPSASYWAVGASPSYTVQ